MNWRLALGDEYLPKSNEDELEVACLPHETYDALDVFGPAGHSETYEKFLSNGYLIAAAPLMLNELKRCRELLGDILDTDEESNAMVLEDIDVVVSKAEGNWPNDSTKEQSGD